MVKTDIDNVFRLKNFDECPMDINEVISDFEIMLEENVSEIKLREYFIKIFPSLKKHLLSASKKPGKKPVAGFPLFGLDLLK